MKLRSLPKRVLALILSAAIFASIGIVSIVSAAVSSSPVRFTVGDVAGKPGTTVTVPIDMEIPEDVLLGVVTLSLKFDTDKYEYISDNLGDSFKGNESGSYLPGEWRFITTKPSGITGSYHVADVTLKIKDSVTEASDFELSVLTCADSDREKLNSKVDQGSVSLNVPLESIRLDQDTLELAKGDTQQLNVVYNPSNTTDDTTVSWSVDKPEVAEVSADGVVTAVGRGTATVTAQVGEFKATCTVNVGVPLASITLDQNKLNLNKGKTASLTVSAQPADTTDTNEYVWGSSNDSVATVDQNGNVTAMGAGTAKITVTRGTKTAECEVSVSVPLESVEVSAKTLELLKGQNQTLTVSYNPEDTTDDKTASWSSSNSAVASVDQNGKVVALKEGQAEITVTAGGKSDVCTVTVTEKHIESIALSQNSLELDRTKTAELTVLYFPEDTTDDREVVWHTEDESVAAVVDGVVTAVGKGVTNVWATVGEKTTPKCEVTVHVPLTGISMAETASVNKNETTTLTYTCIPEDHDSAVSEQWSTSDPTVATVSGGVVTGHKAGKAEITLTVNGFKQTCTVTVNAPLQSISIEGTAALAKGESKTLTVTYDPQDTTDSKEVVWSSSDTSVATVENGVVTAVGKGNAVITATSKAVGVKPVTCTVTVNVPLVSIDFDKTSLTLDTGMKETLNIVANPVDTTDKLEPVEWKSSNPEVASVKDGEVTALKKGTTTITAVINGKTASCEVKVTLPLNSITITPSTADLLKGQSVELSVKFDPADADGDRTIVWTSSDDTVAAVENGVVTGRKEGQATITATVGKVSSTCTVTVTEIKIESVTLDKENLVLNKGDSSTLKATVNPENTTDDKTVTWSSSNKDVVVVDNNGNLTAVGRGNAVITAQAGDKTAECDVTVEVPLGSIALTQSAATLIKGKEFTLEVLFNPEDTTDSKETIWSTSDPSIVTVKDGVVTAVGKGTATVTARVGSLSATCEFKVIEVSETIPTESVLAQLKDDSVKSIEVNLSAPDTVKKELLDAAKGIDKPITFNIVNESGVTLYSWTVNGKDITGNTSDLNLAIEIGENQEQVGSLVGEAKYTVVSFAQQGAFPVKADININLGYTEGQQVWLYRYNQAGNELEAVGDSFTIEKGSVQFSVSEGGVYVFTTQQVKAQEPDDNTPDDGTSSDSTSSNPGSNGSTPKTGDVFSIVMLLAALLSAASAGFMMYARKKHE